ncbi:MAG: hypothetical protein WAK95_20210 [Desulfobacterales bacterium]
MLTIAGLATCLMMIISEYFYTKYGDIRHGLRDRLYTNEPPVVLIFIAGLGLAMTRISRLSVKSRGVHVAEPPRRALQATGRNGAPAKK